MKKLLQLPSPKVRSSLSLTMTVVILIKTFSAPTEEKFEVKAQNDFDKFSFEDAGDPFANEKLNKKTNGNDGNNNFDPFGAPTTANNQKETTSGFGFEADFANFESFNTSKTSNGGDAWGAGGGLDKTNNNVSGKVKKLKEQDISKIRKFSADYSDKFEDIDQVLKRSVVEQ